MTPEQQQDLKRNRENDDQWTGPKLIMLAAGTLLFAFTTIYIISGFNGGH